MVADPLWTVLLVAALVMSVALQTHPVGAVGRETVPVEDVPPEPTVILKLE